MPADSLDGRAALVTGASAGIGRATARVLAREGASVSLLARREERLEDLADGIETEHGVDALVAPTDVTDEDAVDGAVERTVDAFGGIDIVVSNAGVNRIGDVENLSTEKYRQMMRVNCDGTFFLTRAVMPHLRDSAGTLVYVASFAGKYPRPNQPVYSATKWWAQGFGHAIAGELGADDVAVTVLNPTEVATEIGIQDGQPASERFEDRGAAEPEEVAEAIAFCARQESPNTIGELGFYRRNRFDSFRRE
ncbi:MAG: SDR family oxidoreductase [Haloarculaceae archaeon]